ncbi:MAG: hypothetical protein DM484_14790 [Candidatus Methylumidiphilus alinenensis]|uniref:Glycosyltransferase RgtA/B/C/D-like domain-containing protein n=1 Tax=Candidatus Methylumidiphilus alinenensis TaxID=2202197 RepID=A0A2W4R5B8_9GAMM|nr:MAG: hypothetical protein DM484_14790 [Candidatus Methylumidiphilus alinenensis]
MEKRTGELSPMSTWGLSKEKITRNASPLVLASSLLGFAIWSLLLGQDANWDLRNYHYYNAYAFFSGRIDYDIAPGQTQSYLNPALDLLPFLLIQHFPPRVFGIVMGAWHGLNLWLLFLIGRELLARISFPKPALWAAICALVGVRGAAAASEVGTTYHDLTLSVFILGAVYLYLRAWPNFKLGTTSISLQSLAGSGFLLGLATGLKLTFALYAIGMGMAIVVVQVGMLKRFRGIVPFGLAALAGLLLAAGPWMWFLWKHYGNPLFPFYNAFFQSPFFPSFNLFDSRFFPKSAWEAISFPFRFTLREHAGNELSFRDFRVAALLITTLFASGYLLISSLVSRYSSQRSEPKDHSKPDLSLVWLLIFLWVTYIVLLKLFGVYRYLICVELLSPIALVALVGSLTKSRVAQASLMLCLLFLVFNTRVPDWGRSPWSDDFFGVHPPSSQLKDKAVVLVSSDNPLAYVIPFFPPPVRFVRVDGNFLNPNQNTAMTDRIRSVIADSAENLYLLTYSSEVNHGAAVVNQYLKYPIATLGDCEHLNSRIDSTIVLCRLPLSGK